MKDTNNSRAGANLTKNFKETEKKPDSPADMRKVPTDTGYAWIILLGTFTFFFHFTKHDILFQNKSCSII